MDPFYGAVVDKNRSRVFHFGGTDPHLCLEDYEALCDRLQAWLGQHFSLTP